MDEVEKWIEQLKSENIAARIRAAERLDEIEDKRAVPALIRALKDKGKWVRWGAAQVLENIVGTCETIEELEEVEKGIGEGSVALRKEGIDKGTLINIQIKLAKLTRKIAKKKDELAPKRDLLLTDKPKPPKKGKGIYRTVGRTVHLR